MPCGHCAGTERDKPSGRFCYAEGGCEGSVADRAPSAQIGESVRCGAFWIEPLLVTYQGDGTPRTLSEVICAAGENRH